MKWVFERGQNMLKSQLKNNKGTTLLESVFAIVIMSFGFLTILHFLHGMMITTLNQDKTIIGTQLAKQQMEKILRDKEHTGFEYIVNENYPFKQYPSPYHDFSQLVEIADINVGLKAVKVVVSWGPQQTQQSYVDGMLSAH